MDIKIIEHLNLIFNDIEENKDDVTNISNFLLNQIKILAIYTQKYTVAVILRDEQKRRLRLNDFKVNEDDK